VSLSDSDVRLASAERQASATGDALASGALDPPGTASVQAYVDHLLSRRADLQAAAVIEHLFGVRPLIEACFDDPSRALPAVWSGHVLGALGLCTPTPDGGWGAVTLAGVRVGSAVRLRGEIRVARRHSEGSLVLVRVDDDDLRLSWLDHRARGVGPREQGRPGAPDEAAPGWLVVDDAVAGAAVLSRPVTLAPGEALDEHLNAYAGVWALFAVTCARRGVRALRRSAGAARCPEGAPALSGSPLVALGITDVAIETEMTAVAVQQHLGGPATPAAHAGVSLALAAARALAAVADEIAALRDQLGLVVDTPLAAPGAAGALTASLGGILTLENELARRIGLGQHDTRADGQ
jgi:hypothetical protein